MTGFKIADVARAVRGDLVHGSADAAAEGVSTDTRTLRPGQIFFPLRGERHDAHAFLSDAVRAQAACLVVRRDAAQRASGLAGESARPIAVIACDDTLQALFDLASWSRGRSRLPLIAVTGSTGKTTTKEMIAAVLRERGPVLASRGNLNTDVGLSLTLCELSGDHWAGVVELAMRGRGQIRQLAALAQPTVGVVTNISAGHIGVLGSLEAIAAAKAELVEALPPDGWAVLNLDDPQVARMAGRTAARVIGVGRSEDADIRLIAVESLGPRGVRAVVEEGGARWSLETPLVGGHQAQNALAAAAACRCLGMEWEEIQRGLRKARAAQMRMELSQMRGGVLLVNDAYNANPASMEAALRTLPELSRGRRVAVLGGMLDLGPAEKSAHQEVGRQVVEAGVDLLAAVGPLGALIGESAVESGMPAEKVRLYQDAEEAARAAPSWLKEGDTVLVKASRAVGLEEVARAIEEAWGGVDASPAEEGDAG